MEKDYNPEKCLNDHAKSISIEEIVKITGFAKKKIRKILCNKGGAGTGFFCIIPFDDWDDLKVLMTNNHVIGNNDLIVGKKIKFTLDNDRKQKEIILDEKRKKYTSEKYDITIIEIKKNDGIEKESFFEIDNQIFTDYKIYIKQSIYLLHYPKGKEMRFSYEIINNIYEDGYTIQHYYDSDNGSSGGPLLNTIDYKVIGIHKGGAKENQQFNLGTLIKEPIEDFKRKINDKEVVNSLEQTKSEETNYEDKILYFLGKGNFPDMMDLKIP